MKRHTHICLMTVLIVSCIALFACGGDAPKSPPNSASRKVAVQKVQPVPNPAATENHPNAGASPVPPETTAEQGAGQTAGPKEILKESPAAPAASPEEKSTALQPVAEKNSAAAPPIKEEKADAAAAVQEAHGTGAQPALAAGSVQGNAVAAPPGEITSDLIKESLQTASSYDPAGRFDPFEALFKAQSAEAGGSGKGLKDKRSPQTPLERVALSQLKVTAIIRSAAGNRALVEDNTGKGYVVKKGTYIGMNAGRIVEIEKDRIVIEEEVENIMGQLTLKNAELKLQKPAGEL